MSDVVEDKISSNAANIINFNNIINKTKKKIANTKFKKKRCSVCIYIYRTGCM